jgi:hypothetical protein
MLDLATGVLAESVAPNITVAGQRWFYTNLSPSVDRRRRSFARPSLTGYILAFKYPIAMLQLDSIDPLVVAVLDSPLGWLRDIDRL